MKEHCRNGWNNRLQVVLCTKIFLPLVLVLVPLVSFASACRLPLPDNQHLLLLSLLPATPQGRFVISYRPGASANGIRTRHFQYGRNFYETGTITGTVQGQPLLASNSSGRFVAVWKNGTQAYASVYDPATSWGTAASIIVSGGTIVNPAVRLAPDGSAFAMSIQENTTFGSGVRINRYASPAGPWGGAVALGGDAVANFTPQIISDRKGNMLAAWTGGGTSLAVQEVYAAYYTPSGGWGPVEAAPDINPGVEKKRLRGAFSTQGFFGLSWYTVTKPKRLVVAIYRPGSGWETPGFLDNSPGSADSENRMGFDDQGNFMLTWLEGGVVLSKRFDAIQAKWGTLENIQKDLTTAASKPRLARDRSGNYAASWLEKGGTVLNGSVYLAGRGWSVNPIHINEGQNYTILTHQLKMDRSGNILLAWTTNETPSNMYAALCHIRHKCNEPWNLTAAESTNATSVFIAVDQ